MLSHTIEQFISVIATLSLAVTCRNLQSTNSPRNSFLFVFARKFLNFYLFVWKWFVIKLHNITRLRIVIHYTAFPFVHRFTTFSQKSRGQAFGSVSRVRVFRQYLIYIEYVETFKISKRWILCKKLVPATALVKFCLIDESQNKNTPISVLNFLIKMFDR